MPFRLQHKTTKKQTQARRSISGADSSMPLRLQNETTQKQNSGTAQDLRRGFLDAPHTQRHIHSESKRGHGAGFQARISRCPPDSKIKSENTPADPTTRFKCLTEHRRGHTIQSTRTQLAYLPLRLHSSGPAFESGRYVVRPTHTCNDHSIPLQHSVYSTKPTQKWEIWFLAL